MSEWPSARAKRVLAALLRIASHDDEELGPRMLARLAKHTGLAPTDL
jgi:hypothetical protein